MGVLNGGRGRDIQAGALAIVLAAAVSLCCLTESAGAATVEAETVTSATTTNRVSIDFRAASGEANQITISALSQAKAGDPMDVEIVDANAPLEAKAGCSGGGGPGTPVHCVVHGPKGSDYEYCGRDCFTVVPGTEWRLALNVDLGDEANSLDASALPNVFPAIDMTVKGGPSRDKIITGSGNDRIDPGLGDDLVQAGQGYDRVVAAAGFDGNDVYDLGEFLGGEVDYSARSEPLRIEAGVGGGAGEEDHISTALIIGGSAADTLVGGEGFDAFEGGGGNDTLIGKGERDLLYGNAGDDRLSGGDGEDRLIGGPGNDTLEGGAGDDGIMEVPEAAAFGPEPRPVPPEAPGGADVAMGGPGNDWMSLGAEADTAYGEEGDDRIVTGAGTDSINGGPGNDVLAGGAEFDEIRGEAGEDRIFAGPQVPTKSLFTVSDIPGLGPDGVDCGSDEDFVAIDSADRIENCEKVRLERPIQTGKPIRDSRKGSALLPVRVGSPGKVIVSGRGVAKTARFARTNSSGHSIALLPVRPRGATRAALRRSGRRQIQVKVRYLRRDGGAFTVKRHFALVEAR